MGGALMMTNDERLARLVCAEQAINATLTWLRSLHPMRSRQERTAALERATVALNELVLGAEAEKEEQEKKLDAFAAAVMLAEPMLCKEPYCGTTATREDG